MSNDNPDYLSFQCPQCQKRLKAPPALAGKKLACPKCSAAIRVPSVIAPILDEDDWLSLEPPKPVVASPSPKKPEPPSPPKVDFPQEDILDEPIPSNFEGLPESLEAPVVPESTPPIPPKAPSLASRSVFDDDLPDLMPLETTNLPSKSIKDLVPTLELPDIPLADLESPPAPPKRTVSAPPSSKPTSRPKPPVVSNSTTSEPRLVGSLEELSLDEEAFKSQFEIPKDEEFRFPCKVCGSLLYAKESRVGTKTRCPDCFSEFSISSPAPKKQQQQLNLDDNAAAVTLAPLEPVKNRSNFQTDQDKTQEILDRATVAVDRENHEIDEVIVSFDSKRWIQLIFHFVKDPLVCVAAGILGIITAIWLFAIDMIGTSMGLEVTQALILKVVVFAIGIFPIFGSICLCGLVILPMAANRESKVREWPFSKVGDSISECMIFLAALIVGAIPGGMLGTITNALGAMPAVSFGLMMLSVWGITPIILLCMIDSGSVFEPYSKAIIGSLRTHAEAWGAMYMQSALAMLVIFCLLAFSLLKDVVGDIVLGLLFPICTFFIFNQYGILAGRISAVTEMGFHGDFSDD